ncbi:MAG: hypothetical protein WCB36_03390 [Burkholderiales bacterium]
MLEKHFLYLTNHQLISVISRAEKFGAQRVFTLNESGKNEFDVYLGSIKSIPAYLLTDLIEEDFRSDTIPHVKPRDRAQLLERKLGQAYRSTPYRHATLQGREPDGRRDDRVLYTAITNPDLLKPWIDLLTAHKIPLMGIYSAPLLATRLLKYLRLQLEHVLVVTLVAAGVRQNYFQDGMIKFSRLTPLGDAGQNYPSELIAQEVGKTWQYLDSMRYQPRGEALQVYVICHPAEQVRYTSALQGSPQLQYRFLDITQVATMLGQTRLPEDSDSAGIMLNLLAEKIPVNHYAPKEDTYYARIWNARQKLFYAAAGIFVAGAVWTLFNLYSATGLNNDTAQLESQVRALSVQQQTILHRFPKDTIAPDDMRDAMNLYALSLADSPSPTQIMQRLGEVLDNFPNVELKKISWLSSDDPKSLPPMTGTDGEAQSGQAAASNENQTTVHKIKPYQAALLEFALRPTPEEPRPALNEIQRLVQTLNGIKNTQATIARKPMNIDPSGNLRGRLGSGAAPATGSFALQLLLTQAGA